MDRWLPRIVYGFIALVVVLMLGWIGFTCTHHCVRSHREWQPEQTTFDPNTNMTTYTPGYWYEHCDQWEKNK